MAQISQMRLLAVALLIKLRVRVGGRGMAVVRALLAMEVRTVVIASVLRAEALVRGSGLDQCAIDGEILVRYKALRLLVYGGEELLRHVGGKQTLVVLREHRMVPHRIVHAQATNPRNSRL